MTGSLSRRSVHRAGSTLAELLLAMALGAMLLGLSTQLIHRAFVSQSGSLASVRFQNMASRVAHQFRRDTHAANSCDMEGTELKLMRDGSTVVYRAEENVLHRTEVRTGESGARHVDEFVLPESCTFRVDWEAIGENQDAGHTGVAKVVVFINDSLERRQRSPTKISPKTIVIEGAIRRSMKGRVD